MSAIGERAESTLNVKPPDPNTPEGRMWETSLFMVEFFERELSMYVPKTAMMNLAWAASRELEAANFRKIDREGQWPKYDH